MDHNSVQVGLAFKQQVIYLVDPLLSVVLGFQADMD